MRVICKTGWKLRIRESVFLNDTNWPFRLIYYLKKPPISPPLYYLQSIDRQPRLYGPASYMWIVKGNRISLFYSLSLFLVRNDILNLDYLRAHRDFD